MPLQPLSAASGAAEASGKPVGLKMAWQPMSELFDLLLEKSPFKALEDT